MTLYKNDLRIEEQRLKFFSNAGLLRHICTCILLLYQLSTIWLEPAPSISHCSVVSTVWNSGVWLWSDWIVHDFSFSHLGEELLSQSEFTVVQTQHLHPAKQMGHLRRRRWSRGGGTGKNSLNMYQVCLQSISNYTCTHTLYMY